MLQNLAEDYENLMILALIAFFAGVAALISWAFTRPASRGLAHSIEGIVPPFIGLPAVLFSLTAALMATSLWENYNVAIKAVRSESQAIATIIELSDSVSVINGHHLSNYAKEYAQSVVTDEWPKLSHHSEASSLTKKRFEDLRHATYQAADSLNGNAEAKALITAFQTINDGRKTRLGFVSFDVHPIRWYAMIILAVLVQLSTALVHVTKPKALMVAVSVSTVIVLVPICTIAFTLSSPYVGAISISNSPYLAAIR